MEHSVRISCEREQSPLPLKSEIDILKFTCDQSHDAKRTITAEKTTINKLIEQGANSSKSKMAIQKFQEYKAILDESHESRRNLLKLDSLITLSNAEKSPESNELYRSTNND